MGSLSALEAITSQPNWSDRFDITVLQQGWRLGGKCASGRNPDHRQRNEEHGLHVLGGFYHNTFMMLRRCYEEWQQRSPQAIPFDRAFEKKSTFFLSQKMSGQWRHVEIPLENGKVPGVDPRALTPLEMAKALMGLLRDLEGELDNYGELGQAFKERFGEVAADVEGLDMTDLDEAKIDDLVASLGPLEQIIQGLSPHDDSIEASVILVIIELGLLVTRTIFQDGIVFHGFDILNERDALVWLRDRGASKRLLESTFTNSGYEYAFAYVDGDLTKKDFAAGVALRGLLRLLLTFHGSVFVHMRGGMGEIVITPLYEILAQRGVKFRFFHQVKRLVLDGDGTQIDAVEGLVQAKPKAGTESYDPLVEWNGMKVWPVGPKYDLLVNGDVLKQQGTDLESFWADSAGMPPFRLHKGADFDVVVLGIPVGALPTICAELVDRHPRWQRLMQRQKTAPTVSAQFWLLKPLNELGWTETPPLLTGYERPFSTWADMSFLLDLEGDRTAHPYEHLSYVCGPFPRSSRLPDPPAPRFPGEEMERAGTALRDWLRHALADLLSLAGNETNEAFASELEPEVYVRPNINPSDEYVLSTAGSIASRLRADDADVDNLYLTGDWIKTGIDAGAVEVAVVAGLQCSRAITGRPQYIFGETDFH